MTLGAMCGATWASVCMILTRNNYRFTFAAAAIPAILATCAYPGGDSGTQGRIQGHEENRQEHGGGFRDMGVDSGTQGRIQGHKENI
eukprot:1074165-Prorocentrum_minimum.AAC.1